MEHGVTGAAAVLSPKPRRPSSLGGSASRTGAHLGKCIYVGWRAGGWDIGPHYIRQRSSTDLFVNAEPGQAERTRKPEKQVKWVVSLRSLAVHTPGPVPRGGGWGGVADSPLKLDQIKRQARPRVCELCLSGRTH